MEMKSTLPDYSKETRGWNLSEQRPLVPHLPPYNDQVPPSGIEAQSTHHQQRNYGHGPQSTVVYQQPASMVVVQPPPKLEKPPKDYLVHSLFATMCCCTVLGILAIIHAVRSREASTAGDHARAVVQSRKARRFMLGTVVVGAIVITIYIAVEIVLIPPIDVHMSSEELARANLIHELFTNFFTYFL